MVKWKKVPGSNAEVSEDGLIRHNRGVSRGVVSTNSKQPKKSGKYLKVSLYVNGQSVYYWVHRLVAELFIGPCPPGCQVNHKDGNGFNNHYKNLEYVTRKENSRHRTEVLKIPGPRRGKYNPCPEVEKLLAEGMLGIDIAKLTGLSTTTITRIRLKKHWGNSPTGYGLRNQGKSKLTSLN